MSGPATCPHKITLLLLDDHALFRAGLARLLGSEPDFEIAGQCGTVAEALEMLPSRHIDVVLLDVDLGAELGSDFFDGARQMGFQGKVLILTAGAEPVEAADLLAKGASGVYLKSSAPDRLARSIREVMAGGTWIDEQYSRCLIELAASSERHSQHSALSARERDVLRCVFQGLGNKQTADRLGTSEMAVKGALQRLFEKTGVRSRSQLVRFALKFPQML